MAGSSPRLSPRPCVEIVDMILDEAAVAAENRAFPRAPKPLQEAAGELQIGCRLVGVEVGRSAFRAVRPGNIIVAIHVACPSLRGGRHRAVAVTGTAGRDTGRGVSETACSISTPPGAETEKTPRTGVRGARPHQEKTAWVMPGGTGSSVPCDSKLTVQTPPPARSLASYGKSGSPPLPRAPRRAGLLDQRDQISLCSPSSPWLSVA